MIRNIVFDMGGVLLDYRAERFVNELVEDVRDHELLLNEVFRSVEWIQLDRGSITEDDFLRSVCARLPERLHKTAQLLLESWHLYIPLIDGMDELCAELKANGYHLYLLSNTSNRFYRYREKITALRHFDGEFISADWCLLKPDVAIYRAFCAHYALVPSRCFFVDDLPANIEGAMCSGMQGFVFRGDIEALRIAMQAAGVSVSSMCAV